MKNVGLCGIIWGNHLGLIFCSIPTEFGKNLTAGHTKPPLFCVHLNLSRFAATKLMYLGYFSENTIGGF